MNEAEIKQFKKNTTQFQHAIEDLVKIVKSGDGLVVEPLQHDTNTKRGKDLYDNYVEAELGGTRGFILQEDIKKLTIAMRLPEGKFYISTDKEYQNSKIYYSFICPIIPPKKQQAFYISLEYSAVDKRYYIDTNHAMGCPQPVIFVLNWFDCNARGCYHRTTEYTAIPQVPVFAYLTAPKIKSNEAGAEIPEKDALVLKENWQERDSIKNDLPVITNVYASTKPLEYNDIMNLDKEKKDRQAKEKNDDSAGIINSIRNRIGDFFTSSNKTEEQSKPDL